MDAKYFPIAATLGEHSCVKMNTTRKTHRSRKAAGAASHIHAGASLIDISPERRDVRPQLRHAIHGNRRRIAQRQSRMLIIRTHVRQKFTHHSPRCCSPRRGMQENLRRQPKAIGRKCPEPVQKSPDLVRAPHADALHEFRPLQRKSRACSSTLEHTKQFPEPDLQWLSRSCVCEIPAGSAMNSLALPTLRSPSSTAAPNPTIYPQTPGFLFPH